MSLITLAAVPVQAILPVAEAIAGNAASVARPLAGAGALVAVGMMFKPLLRGVLRAALLSVTPRRLSAQERRERDAVEVENLARYFEGFDPGQAADLRAMLARG